MRGSVYIRPRALRYRWGVQQYPHTKVTTQHNVSFPFPRHPFIPMVKHQWVGPVIFGHDFRCIVSYIWQKSHLVPFANRKFLRDSIPLPNFPGLCSCYYSLNIHPRATEVPQKKLRLRLHIIYCSRSRSPSHYSHSFPRVWYKSVPRSYSRYVSAHFGKYTGTHVLPDWSLHT